MKAARQARRPWRSCLALVGLLACFFVSAPAWSSPASGTSAAAEKQASDRVELNSADVEELCTLPGIGPKKAEAIIAYREQRRFTRVTQLLRIRGIGTKTLERLRPLIYVAPLPRVRPRPPAAPPSGPTTQPRS